MGFKPYKDGQIIQAAAVVSGSWRGNSNMSQESYISYRLSETELRRIEEERRKLEEANRRAEEERIRGEAIDRLSWAQDVDGLRTRVGQLEAPAAQRNAARAMTGNARERLHEEVVHLEGLLEEARQEGRDGALAEVAAAAERALSSASTPGSFAELRLLSLEECGMRVEAAVMKRRQDRAHLLVEARRLAKTALLEKDRQRAAELLARLEQGHAPEDLATSIEDVVRQNREVEQAAKEREYVMTALRECLSGMGYSVEHWSSDGPLAEGTVRTSLDDAVELSLGLDNAVHTEFHAAALTTDGEAESRCHQWCNRWADVQRHLEAQGITFHEHWSKPPNSATAKRREQQSGRKPGPRRRTI